MNQLGLEKSPYLLQHKDNPIHWMAWGDEAFRLAREQNKPLFLSVGYSTCHWCHVMAHESFEDSEVAEVLNAGFICIKVDREERPDVDHVYMTALQAISGGGGWPMSVWLTSEGKPFFAGTYFPKYRLLQLLRRINEMWASEADKLFADSERLLESVRHLSQSENQDNSETDHEEFLKSYITHFQHHFDEANGGFGGAPKFPQTMNLMVMMRQDYVSGLAQAEVMVNTTLLKMLRGGVYDQLAGGFHRYAVDAEWQVPHFEKMLYDQALIVTTMVEAFQLYGEAELARGIRETCDYVLRELTHEEGGFYAAQDADSLNSQTGHNEEGYFCTYSYEELRDNLEFGEFELLEKVYGVSIAGGFEGRNILNLQEAYDGKIKNDPILQSALSKLRVIRSAKPAPHLDDKVIAAWNGYMIAALVKAGLALHEPRYLKAAAQSLSFARDGLYKNQELNRFWREGEARGRAAAEDYTSMIHACLEVYQADFDERWAEWALTLQKQLDNQFWDIEEGLYFANDGRESLLPLRLKDDYDGVTPCSNSLAAYNLNRLYLLTGERKFKQQSERITQALFPRLKRYPSGLPFLALALDFQLAQAKVAVLNGGAWVKEYHLRERATFKPHLLWAHADTLWPVTVGKSGGPASIYVCEEGHCLKPAASASEILAKF